jgi:hypothetical protein
MGGGGDWFAPRVTLGVGAGIGGVFTMLAYVYDTRTRGAVVE